MSGMVENHLNKGSAYNAVRIQNKYTDEMIGISYRPYKVHNTGNTSQNS